MGGKNCIIRATGVANQLNQHDLCIIAHARPTAYGLLLNRDRLWMR